MIGRKQLRDVQRDLVEVLSKLPSGKPDAWLDREIKAGKKLPGRDSETLKLLKSALKRAAKKKRSGPNVPASR